MSHPPRQLPLGLPLQVVENAALVEQKARALFARSTLLRSRYKSCDEALANPITGRCLRMAAAALLRSGAG